MKQLEQCDLKFIAGGTAGGGTGVPELPPRTGEKEKKLTNADGSYKASTLPVETNTPDEG
ncbi:hypothetical protein [Pseudoalteromonas phenolica]|uniref:Uncharacterized protein n=1 Tax=Pseudoalteromonas phenolica TaxID=161398 RepID=A0A0S2K7N9_9GAMM|nr:hypothetical protein [Pseudoalteromonas phenolica]ALO43986.1 hypothetical protein PP2015_3512 [Pseudoalteromonas phenolica]MBE0356962.1 hypothetical protein [Pseudoalteromonas phenolica O-BC30]RXE96116.1 hypothetical protein D9981_12950 [Pseudoalteromonas phenolica O-BC30]